MKTSLLEFDLPLDRIPNEPLKERGTSRLMVLPNDGRILHHQYRDLPDVIRDLLGNDGWVAYLNNSRVRNASVPSRRQPIYADVEGSLATPSAGLDVTEDILNQMSYRFLTLHAGMDCFRKIQTDEVEQHRLLNPEWYNIPSPPAEGEQVVAIGTSVVKAIETWARDGYATGKTDLFISPGFEFKRIRALLTNFHTPHDTHLALTCAFGGVERVMEAYQVALREGYRWSSWGDACLIL